MTHPRISTGVHSSGTEDDSHFYAAPPLGSAPRSPTTGLILDIWDFGRRVPAFRLSAYILRLEKPIVNVDLQNEQNFPTRPQLVQLVPQHHFISVLIQRPLGSILTASNRPARLGHRSQRIKKSPKKYFGALRNFATQNTNAAVPSPRSRFRLPGAQPQVMTECMDGGLWSDALAGLVYPVGQTKKKSSDVKIPTNNSANL